MDLELKNKVAVITGGSVGIGLAVAEGLAAEGAHIALIAVMASVPQPAPRKSGRSTVSRPSASGLTSPVVKTSHGLWRDRSGVRRRGYPDQQCRHRHQRDHHGRAGREVAVLLDLHVMAAVRMSRGLIPSMRWRGGGVILMNASICAEQPLGYEPIYNVTKAGLMMFAKCLSNEVIGDNIRVNCVNPGLVLTGDWVRRPPS